MKSGICRILYGLLALAALAGLTGAAVLYPTHAANGTSVGYFTMVLFPALFLLLGLSGILFRFWYLAFGVCWLALAGYLLHTEGGTGGFFLLLAVYFLLAMTAGLSGASLRKDRRNARRKDQWKDQWKRD